MLKDFSKPVCFDRNRFTITFTIIIYITMKSEGMRMFPHMILKGRYAVQI